LEKRVNMETQIRIETGNDQIEEIKTVHSDEEANRLLQKGWIYLWSGAVHIDTMGYNVKPIFTLGLKKLVMPKDFNKITRR